MSTIFRDGFNDVMWTCHICKQERPDAQISVRKKPLVGLNGVASRAISENIRYCNDNPVCAEESKTFSFLRNW